MIRMGDIYKGEDNSWRVIGCRYRYEEPVTVTIESTRGYIYSKEIPAENLKNYVQEAVGAGDVVWRGDA